MVGFKASLDKTLMFFNTQLSQIVRFKANLDKKKPICWVPKRKRKDITWDAHKVQVSIFAYPGHLMAHCYYHLETAQDQFADLARYDPQCIQRNQLVNHILGPKWTFHLPSFQRIPCMYK